MTGALAGLRVVEIAGDIAGPYCTKLLADLGAEVTKIEPPTGDPLRNWGPFPGGVKDPDKSGHVRIPQRREARRDNRSRCRRLSLANSSSHRPTSFSMECRPGALDRFGLDTAPTAVTAPWPCRRPNLSFRSARTATRPEATPLTVQAASGWINLRDPDRPPVQAGREDCRVRRRCLRRVECPHSAENRSANTSHVVEVDVSVMESLLSTLPYPMLLAEKMRSLGLPRQLKGRPGDGGGARRGRLARDQLSDGTALARCLRDARAYRSTASIRSRSCWAAPSAPNSTRRPSHGFRSEQSTRSSNSCQALRIPATPVNDGATVLELPAVPRSRVLCGCGGRRLVVPSPGRPIPAVEDARPAGSGRTPSRPTRRAVRRDGTAAASRVDRGCRSTT